jgi:hypothetical protein
MRNGKAPFPESELRNMYATNPDVSMGDYKSSTDAIHKAIGAGAQKRDYSRITVPILSLFSWSCSKKISGPYVCIKHPHHNPLYKAKTQSGPKDAQERAAIDAFDDATDRRWEHGEDLSLVEFKSFEYQQSKQVVADEDIKESILKIGIRKLERDTGVSHHTLDKILKGEHVRRKTLAKIVKQLQLLTPFTR